MNGNVRWWQQNLFWGPFGISVAIMLAVVAVMKDIRWLLIFAWPWLLLGVWVSTWNIRSLLVRCTVITTAVALAAIGCYTLYISPHRSRISDAQLCSQANALTQRMRVFEHERWAQHDRSVDQLRDLMGKAKTKEENETIRKKFNDELNSFLSRYQSDFDSTFRAEAKRLRSELLIRLSSREQSQARANQILFDGPLVGARPVARLADLLDDLAKKVCPASGSGESGKPLDR